MRRAGERPGSSPSGHASPQAIPRTPGGRRKARDACRCGPPEAHERRRHRDPLQRETARRNHLAGLRPAGRKAQRRLGRLLVHGISRRRRRTPQDRGAESIRQGVSRPRRSRARRARVRRRGLRGLVPVRSPGRAAADQAPARVSRRPRRTARLADHVLLRRQGVPWHRGRVRRAQRCAARNRVPRWRQGRELSGRRRRSNGVGLVPAQRRPRRCSNARGSSERVAWASITGWWPGSCAGRPGARPCRRRCASCAHRPPHVRRNPARGPARRRRALRAGPVALVPTFR